MISTSARMAVAYVDREVSAFIKFRRVPLVYRGLRTPPPLAFYLFLARTQLTLHAPDKSGPFLLNVPFGQMSPLHAPAGHPQA